MTSYKDLYDALKLILPSGVNYSFNILTYTDERNGIIETKKNTCKIHIRQTRNSNRLVDGSYSSAFAGITFKYVAGNNETDLITGYNFISEVMEIMDSLINTVLSTKDGKQIRIKETRKLGNYEQYWDWNNNCCFNTDYEIEYKQ